jgi:hypothetical protein
MIALIEEWSGVGDEGAVGGFIQFDWAALLTPTDDGWDVLVGYSELDYPQRRSLYEKLPTCGTLDEAKKAVDEFYLTIQGGSGG